MKPSIGRIVIYKFTESEPKPNGAEECPAVIVRVWSDNCVNLRLIEDGPCLHWKTSVVLQDGPDGRGQWHWPVRE